MHRWLERSSSPIRLRQTMSIPDQYLADGGIAYPVPKIRGMAAKFGMRYEGVKVRDLKTYRSPCSAIASAAFPT
jgi:hypothetical protein